MDINMIKDILPHRYPFLLVDRVLEMDNETIKALKNVTMNEEFFLGHFPENPVMPGVLIIEALAQAGGILAFQFYSEEEKKNAKVYFMAIDNAKFRKPVIPGDQLMLEVSVVKRKKDVWKLKGEAKVDGAVVCEAEFMAMVQK
ncbi:3R-hydroxymyristoyl ACP dehydrase [Deferribacter desulfuricans SSM1]|uniref:3-hydroxyacyl-[acyl-carrier-protein] dehydratase FabZ n=1 Tax=Deferribacter desulfuricans (strain DSM 14783 / JCM 11476 / NBRC 101012 / SSM1) TaxID=639282 RepID=D3PAJ6_DEFDS|nr:3-hydroxyacyl-ACP dehydratase FabZ [Deferribacter desulfuricans]BAI79619.1 3R-hydroxymyristoyl ACP dehydrase [Deferribacter desulfuricans SSM1]